MSKIHLKVMKNYVKPVARVLYRLGQLHYGSKRFVRVEKETVNLHLAGRPLSPKDQIDTVSGLLYIDSHRLPGNYS